MQIQFNSAESFLKECIAAKGNGTPEDDTLADNLVRIEISSEGTHCKTYTLLAGFMDSFQTLYQFQQNCGRTPPNGGEKSGELIANELWQKMSERLNALGIEVREGTFVGG